MSYWGFTLEQGTKSIATISEKKNKNKDKDKDKDASKEKKEKKKDVKYLDIIQKDEPTGLQNAVKITDKDLELFPLMVRQGDNAQPNRVFIAGQSLCGKSYFAHMLAKDYNKLFPKNKVAFVSWVKDDSSLNDKKIKNFCQLDIDEKIIHDPLTLEEMHNKLVIFDDVEALSDKNVKNELFDFRNKCINAGRHEQVDVIVCRQNLLDAHKTRDILNGVFQVVIFPHSASRYQARQWMERYLMLPKRIIDKILNVPSRWVLLNTAHPMYALHSKGAFMLTGE